MSDPIEVPDSAVYPSGYLSPEAYEKMFGMKAPDVPWWAMRYAASVPGRSNEALARAFVTLANLFVYRGDVRLLGLLQRASIRLRERRDADGVLANEIDATVVAWPEGDKI